jgi:hypothetical protein
MDKRDRFAIARLYDIKSFLGLHGRGPWVCPLPQHVHSRRPTPSFGVRYDRDRVQRFKCFGTCGLSGDIVDLVGYMNVPGYSQDGESVLRAVSMLANEYLPPEEPPKIERKPILRQDLWQELLPPGETVIEYAFRRGISEQTLTYFNVGQKGLAMAIPIFDEVGTLRAIKYRSTNFNPRMRYWSEPGSVIGLFNAPNVAFTSEPVAIVKGEIAAMVMHEYGLLACAPSSGEGAQLEECVQLLSFSERRIVIGDNDRNPEVRMRMQMFALKRADLFRAELYYPPSEWKDVDQWILEDPTALPTIRSWLSSDARRSRRET